MTKETYSTKAHEILDVAETHMRKGGFDAVSFRDLASAVGVKSASVHYHFPQKIDLGQAVVARYRERVMKALGDPDTGIESASERLEQLLTVYRTALANAESVCLCNMLGAEAQYLPDDVAAEVSLFFEGVLSWAEKALDPTSVQVSAAGEWASFIVGSMQGAMVLAVATGDHTHFSKAEKLIRQSVKAVFS